MILGAMLSAMNASKVSVIFWQDQSDLTISSVGWAVGRLGGEEKLSYIQIIAAISF
nr:hypothetical protein [Octadecabacter antarcticus]